MNLISLQSFYVISLLLAVHSHHTSWIGGTDWHCFVLMGHQLLQIIPLFSCRPQLYPLCLSEKHSSISCSTLTLFFPLFLLQGPENLVSVMKNVFCASDSFFCNCSYVWLSSNGLLISPSILLLTHSTENSRGGKIHLHNGWSATVNWTFHNQQLFRR